MKNKLFNPRFDIQLTRFTCELDNSFICFTRLDRGMDTCGWPAGHKIELARNFKNSWRFRRFRNPKVQRYRSFHSSNNSSNAPLYSFPSEFKSVVSFSERVKRAGGDDQMYHC